MEVDSVTDLAPAATESTANTSNGNDSATVRSDAIHLVGVDDLNSNDIEKFLVRYYNKPFQLEWIDDSSLNIVYDDSEDAFQALVAITAPEEFESPEPIAPEHLRRTKLQSENTETDLKARFALTTDKKASGSRAKSRYYLLHGEPTRKDDLVRFGTKRSKPMVYGYAERDILSKSQREKRSGDLFPEKAPTMAVDSEDLGDLLPNKATKRGRRGRGKGRQNRNKEDLFAHKLTPKKAMDDKKDGSSNSQSTPASAAPTTVYQNMDY